MPVTLPSLPAAAGFGSSQGRRPSVQSAAGGPAAWAGASGSDSERDLAALGDGRVPSSGWERSQQPSGAAPAGGAGSRPDSPQEGLQAPGGRGSPGSLGMGAAPSPSPLHSPRGSASGAAKSKLGWMAAGASSGSEWQIPAGGEPPLPAFAGSAAAGDPLAVLAKVAKLQAALERERSAVSQLQEQVKQSQKRCGRSRCLRSLA